MWELIHSNIRKSWLLFISMGICLVILGYVIGAVWFPPDGGYSGIFIALGVWFFLSLLAYFSGDSILLLSSGAKEVTHDFSPQLFNIVEEMKIASGFPTLPKIYIIPTEALNAFATGRNVKTCSIAITSGLLSRLNRDQLQGVIAHEMSHVVNRDVLYMTFAGIMLGSIVMLSEIFLRSMLFSSGSSRRYSSGSSRGGGQAQAILFIVAIIFAILAPILARIFYFSLSRKREYLADASAVRLTRYPEGLASALEVIATSAFRLESANKVTAPMYITDPFQSKMYASGSFESGGEREVVSLFSTHPPITERIKILRSLTGGVNYNEYQKALISVKGKSVNIMPSSTLRDSEAISIRKPTAEEDKERDKKQKTRDTGDLIRALNKYVFLTCPCSLKIKIPPNFKEQSITCPRCGRLLDVPLVNTKAALAVFGATIVKDVEKDGITTISNIKPQTYVRKTQGWESFNCACGNLLQLSPAFSGNYVRCPQCGQKTEIKS